MRRPNDHGSVIAVLLIALASCVAAVPMEVEREGFTAQEAPPDHGRAPVETAPEEEAPEPAATASEPSPSAEELAAVERLRSDLDRAELLVRRKSTLDARLIWARVARELPGSLESIRAALSLAEDAMVRRDPKVAERWIGQASLPDLPEQVLTGVETLAKLGARRRALVRRLASWPDDPDRESSAAGSGDGRSIGVLLPLSGPYGRFGQMAKQGLDLAFEGSSVSLRVADTQGKADVARVEALRLIQEEGVTLLVGPVGREETRAAAEVSQAHEVAMITLSSFPGALTGLSTGVRIRFSPGDHARAVARLSRSYDCSAPESPSPGH
mgnify:CR=1 FL=1